MDEIEYGRRLRKLEELRKEIASIDLSIIRVLRDRIRLAEEVARVKSDLHLPLRDAHVEEEVVLRMEEACRSQSLDPELGEKIARLIILHSLKIQKAVATQQGEEMEGA